jgi:hypothetical protein
MPGIGGFDVVTQLREDVASDLLTRLLGDASTQDPTSSGYVPGQLIYPPAPLQPEAMVWWDAPKVTLTDDQYATLSLALHGGVRQAPSAMDQGRIGTLSGTVTGRMRPVLGTTAGAQHLSLALDALDLGGLRVAYGESNALPLIGVGGTAQPLRDAIVESVVRDVLSSAMLDALLRGLLTSMGRLPLVYGMGLTGVQTVGKGAGLRIFSAREGSVVAIASPLPGMVGDTERVENALAQHQDSNMTVSVSSVALTAVAMQLLVAGKVARQMRAQSGAEARLESIGVQAHAGFLTLAAHLASGPVKATAALNATLALDRAATRLQLGVGTAHVELDTLLAGMADEAAARGQAAVQTVSAGLGAAFWGDVLAALFGARYRDGTLELVPVVSAPGSGVRVVGTLTGLELEEGHITLYCSVPTDATYTGQKPDKQPQVAITQPEIPLQAAPGAPVRALVEAQVSTESYRPYDFAWKATAASALLPVHGPRLEVAGTPTGRADDPEPIGKAHIALIDSFGQVASADGAAQAHPAKRQSSRRLRRLVQACAAAAIIAALTLGGIAFAGGLPRFGGTAMPTATATSAPGVGFVVSPISPISVACSSLSAQALLGPIVLDNNAGRADTPWQASITDLAPGGGEPWASFTDGSEAASGTVPAGQTEQLRLQPAPDLCRRVYDTKAQQTFHVAVTYGNAGGAGQASVTMNVGVSLVSVSVQTSASQSKTSNTTLTQVCNSSTDPVQPFGILLDGSQSTTATPYQIVISDPPPDNGGTVTPTPGGPSVWATADSSSGTVPADGQQTVTITPATNLCAGVPQGQSVKLHVSVQLAPGTPPVQITDTVETLIP